MSKCLHTLKTLWILLKEIKWLWHIFDINETDKPVKYAETVEFKPISFRHFNINLIIKGRPTIPKVDIQPEQISKDGKYWYHINGMVADKTELNSNCDYMQELFGCHINRIYNPTDGFLQDLWQIYSGRVLNRFEPESKQAKEVIAKRLRNGDKVVLIVHSQGGIICSNVMKLLAEDADLRDLCKNLEVYTFASGMDEFKKPNPNMVVEHFANEYDYVARVGVMSSPKEIEGILYVRPSAKGHLLNRNYMGAFVKGLYCNKSSRLYSYLTII